MVKTCFKQFNYFGKGFWNFWQRLFLVEHLWTGLSNGSIRIVKNRENFTWGNAAYSSQATCSFSKKEVFLKASLLKAKKQQILKRDFWMCTTEWTHWKNWKGIRKTPECQNPVLEILRCNLIQTELHVWNYHKRNFS